MFNKIVIIGCGLIGSSIAGAVRQKKLAREIVGIEVHNIEDVKKLSFFDSVKKSILEVNQADFVIISTPVASLANVFFDLADRHYVKKFGLVTDVLSTKKSLLNSINYLDTKKKDFFCQAFLSSHPLAGSEKIGAIAADISLFENSKVLICPFSDACKPVSPLSKEDKEREYKNFEILKIFWSSIGGTIKTLPINQHDNFFAGISHFPHLVSFCLALILSRSDFASQALSLHGGGLRDTTRIAGASPDLWSDIIFDNKEEVVNLIEQWKINWNELSDTLKNSDKDEFKKLLLEASDWRNNFEK